MIDAFPRSRLRRLPYDQAFAASLFAAIGRGDMVMLYVNELAAELCTRRLEGDPS